MKNKLWPHSTVTASSLYMIWWMLKIGTPLLGALISTQPSVPSTQPSVPSEWLSFAYFLLLVFFINFNRKEGVILYIPKMTHGDYSLKVFNFYILYRYKYIIRKVLSRINDKHFLLQIRRGIRIISKWIMRCATYHK